MVILTFIQEGSISSLWGIFAGGVIFAIAGAIGVSTGPSLRPSIRGLVCIFSLL